MHAHCDEVGRRQRLSIVVSADDDCHPPNRVTALTLFRIMQEALHNAAEHGQARQAVVTLKRTDGRLRLTVGDDGAGFDVAASRGGLGLVSMEERARLAGGCVQVHSEVGRGTTIRVDVPFDLIGDGDPPITDRESGGLGRSAAGPLGPGRDEHATVTAGRQQQAVAAFRERVDRWTDWRLAWLERKAVVAEIGLPTPHRSAGRATADDASTTNGR
jgi:hypothetical protein